MRMSDWSRAFSRRQNSPRPGEPTSSPVSRRNFELEPSALGDDAGERRQVDRVLALVVGRAPAVVALAFLPQHPGIEPRAPLRLEAADDVAVAVGQDGRQPRVFETFADEEGWTVRADGIVEEPHLVAHALERRADLLGEIGGEMRPALLHLALGLVGDAARQVADEAAVVEALYRPLDRLVARHPLLPRSSAKTPPALGSG
jgi:hypothetical protein